MIEEFQLSDLSRESQSKNPGKASWDSSGDILV